jgi:hypothetical protein
MASLPTTDDLGACIAAALDLGDSVINAHIPDARIPVPGLQPQPDTDCVEHIDASDRSNIRITTERGAVFVVRIIREG